MTATPTPSPISAPPEPKTAATLPEPTPAPNDARSAEFEAGLVEAVARVIEPGAWLLLDVYRGNRARLDAWKRGELDISLAKAIAALRAARDWGRV